MTPDRFSLQLPLQIRAIPRRNGETKAVSTIKAGSTVGGIAGYWIRARLSIALILAPWYVIRSFEQLWWHAFVISVHRIQLESVASTYVVLLLVIPRTSFGVSLC
jgi:hypothetical protein